MLNALLKLINIPAIVGKVKSLIGSAFTNRGGLRKAKVRINSAGDSLVCKLCRSKDGTTVHITVENNKIKAEPINEGTNWGKTNNLPPFHPNCRCRAEIEV